MSAQALAVVSGHTNMTNQDGVYCSRRCGFGCTRAAYERAEREAIVLSALMGDGWEPRVWENWGWHYEAIKGVASVNPDTLGGHITGDWVISGYTAWINHERGGQSICKAETPHEAMGLAIEDCRQKLMHMLSDLDGLRPFPLTVSVVAPALPQGEKTDG